MMVMRTMMMTVTMRMRTTVMMIKAKAKLPPPMSGWQEMTGMGWADIDMKVRSIICGHHPPRIHSIPIT